MAVQRVPQVRQDALRDIDAAAGDARLRYITEVPGQQAVYLVKLAEAAAYVAAHQADPQTATPGPYLVAVAAATDSNALDVAQEIVAVAAQWSGVVGPAIEAARLGGKHAVANATGDTDEATRGAIDAARAAAIDALSTI